MTVFLRLSKTGLNVKWWTYALYRACSSSSASLRPNVAGVGRKCQAFGTGTAKAPLSPMTIERRALTAEDVGIDIMFCGLCHSDVHIINNEWRGSKYPLVPGHEIVGRVTSTGQNVSKYKLGDVVGVGFYVDSCRECSLCKSGRSNYCSGRVNVFNSKYKRDGNKFTLGGFSKYIVVDHNYINRIPDRLAAEKAAPLLCAGVTTFTPMQRCAVGKGTQLAVNGLGGLGHMAVKFGVAMGAEVTVVSSSKAKEVDAKKLGAKGFIHSGTPSNLRNYVQKFDVLVNAAPVASSFEGVLNLLKVGGTMIMVSLPTEPLSLQAASLVHFERTITGSLIGSVEQNQRTLDYCAKKDISPEVELIPMSGINRAIEKMLKNDVRYRFVVDMSTL